MLIAHQVQAAVDSLRSLRRSRVPRFVYAYFLIEIHDSIHNALVKPVRVVVQPAAKEGLYGLGGVVQLGHKGRDTALSHFEAGSTYLVSHDDGIAVSDRIQHFRVVGFGRVVASRLRRKSGLFARRVIDLPMPRLFALLLVHYLIVSDSQDKVVRCASQASADCDSVICGNGDFHDGFVWFLAMANLTSTCGFCRDD
ncbi:MAG: hypothetical protein IPK19_06915 [Chloroflexi bacterium]|nr:hypothetical protein [Chloroflexota bacterium]